jgi:TonB family protein
MGISGGKRILAGAVLGVLLGGMVSAQQVSVEDSKRKVKSKVNPVYSDLARRMSLSGKVKVEVTIAQDGHVKSARPVGGHPVLVQSCLDAVKDWKFEPGPEETLQIIEFDFRQ